MCLPFRWLGYLFLIAMLMVLGYDGITALHTKVFQPIDGGQLWTLIDANSMAVAEQAIKAKVGAFLWSPVTETILRQPVIAVLGILGLLLAWGCRRRADFDDDEDGYAAD